jgi:hypothetical protein
MTQLSAFFKDSHTDLGSVFNPKNFVFAAFPSYQLAQQAYGSLRDAGFSENEMLAATDTEVLDFFDEYRKNEGAWGTAMRGLSHLIDTEAKYIDTDIELAKAGAGFVVAHCSAEEKSARIGQTVRPFSPISMQWYRPIGVEELK